MVKSLEPEMQQLNVAEVRQEQSGPKEMRFPSPTQTTESSESNGRSQHSLENQGRRPRWSLLLLDKPEMGGQLGVHLNTDRGMDKTDEMVSIIIRDAELACTCRGDENHLDLTKMGIKLPMPKYSGSDSIEHFLRFTKESMKWMSMCNLVRPEHISYHTDIIGQMLDGEAKQWFLQTVGNNSEVEYTLEEAMVALKCYFVKDALSRDTASKFDHIRQKQ